MKFNHLSHLEFKLKEIEDYDNFIKNRKYIQVCKKYKYTIVHIVIYREDCKNNTYCLSFSLYKEIEHYETNESPNCHYYEVVSKKQKNQEAMEQRALNLILQNIIGDKMFQW